MSTIKITLEHPQWIEDFDLSQLSPEVRESLACAFDVGDELLILDVDDSGTALTGELIIRLKPSSRFLCLVATGRTGDANE